MHYSAVAVANAFLELSKRDKKPLTNMQLQKLVYIAHGWSLALLGKPLFFNNVHAFEYGPVIPKLYKPLRKYGAGVVTDTIPTDDPIIPQDSQEMAMIEAVWESYGHLSGLQLSAITHEDDTPWRTTWEAAQYGVIPNEIIGEHYRQLWNERSETNNPATEEALTS